MFWTQLGGGLTSKKGIYGEAGKIDTMMCATYAKTSAVAITGGSTGNLYIWMEETLKGTIQAHQGPVYVIQALEKVTYVAFVVGILCLSVCT